MIDITKKQLLIIKKILNQHLSDVEIRVFGSRINGKAKPYSDLDIVIVGKTKIDSKILMNLKMEFEESDIPFRVDILDWYRISKEFRQIINLQYIVLK